MKKVVIVDDEIWAIESIKEAVDWNIFGFEIVRVFTSSKNALEYLREYGADLVIIDIKMPNIDGLSLIEQIRCFDKEMQFIIVSGLLEFENARRAISLDVAEFLVKPIDSESLSNVLINLNVKLGGKGATKLSSISALTEKLPNFHNVGDEAYVKYLSLKRRYAYFFTVMSDESTAEWLADRCAELLSNGEFHQFMMTEAYVITILYTDVYLDYNGIISAVEKRISARFGIGLIKENFVELPDAVNESRQAFFRSFVTQKKGVYVFEKKSGELFNIIFKRLNNVIKQRDIVGLNALIERIFTDADSFNIDEILLLCNSILLAINLMLLHGSNDYLPSSEYIEKRFKNISQLKNRFYLKINEFAACDNDSYVASSKNITSLVKEYINTHFHEQISLNTIAEKFGKNEKYIGKIFKMDVGENIVQYINQVRIENALKMLAETNLSIQEISDACGYNDYSYFARVFKRLTGVSASVVRRKFPSNN